MLDMQDNFLFINISYFVELKTLDTMYKDIIQLV